MATQPQPTTVAATGTQRPEASFRYGAVSAAVFVHERTRADGSTFTVRQVLIQRSYRDQSGTWQTTNSFDPNDLPKLALAAADAYKHCLAATKGAREPGVEG